MGNTEKSPAEYLRENWGEYADPVIKATIFYEPYGGTFKDFLEECTACGGNWGGMLLTGIHKLFPMVWDAIPDSMGPKAFFCICSVLELCGVEMEKQS